MSVPPSLPVIRFLLNRKKAVELLSYILEKYGLPFLGAKGADIERDNFSPDVLRGMRDSAYRWYVKVRECKLGPVFSECPVRTQEGVSSCQSLRATALDNVVLKKMPKKLRSFSSVPLVRSSATKMLLSTPGPSISLLFFYSIDMKGYDLLERGLVGTLDQFLSTELPRANSSNLFIQTFLCNTFSFNRRWPSRYDRRKLHEVQAKSISGHIVFRASQ